MGTQQVPIGTLFYAPPWSSETGHTMQMLGNRILIVISFRLHPAAHPSRLFELGSGRFCALAPSAGFLDK
eukprot:CAMPEP_0181392030 /NCGR_PEP_ID=MMETSP1106-20121128/26366_1 /TAXON_ID=81844 /ORGANISM="Mantoniella antarctica, Strain SL-175" /LENGTH=69 /DNA_ID=CAMNT_0023513111 /DNA_START=1357 /DNA_END=1566 /DNA_ORIENTATION=-